jgi:hypothetical protein
MKLVISGSRAVTPIMIHYAQRAVRRAHQLGWEILVGDANGIDAAVIAEADRLKVKLTVYGITRQPRNASQTGVYVTVRTPPGTPKDKYTFRDQHMIAQADIALFVWNGASQGTEQGYRFAQNLGIRAYLVQPT